MVTQGKSSTLAGIGGKVVVQRPKGVSFGFGYLNESSGAQAGMIITGDGETSPDLCLVDASGEEAAGVLVRMVGTAAATAPDTDFTDNEPIEYAPRGSGMVCYVKFISNNGWNPGEWLVHSGTTGYGEGAWEEADADNLSTCMNAFRDLIGTAVEYQDDTSDGSGDYTFVFALVRLSL